MNQIKLLTYTNSFQLSTFLFYNNDHIDNGLLHKINWIFYISGRERSEKSLSSYFLKTFSLGLRIFGRHVTYYFFVIAKHVDIVHSKKFMSIIISNFILSYIQTVFVNKQQDYEIKFGAIMTKDYVFCAQINNLRFCFFS